jgi:glycosyltransferase involved in cell wall biosynthesis
LRIAYVITRADEIGGAQVHVRDLATAMHNERHEVTVIAGRPGALSAQLAERGVPFKAVPALVREVRPASDLEAFRRLRALLAEGRPDLVSTHSSKAGWLGRLAARAMRIPALFTAHGWAFTEGVPQSQRHVYALAERLAAPLAERIITVSEYDRALALRRGIAPPDKITCIHNGVHDCNPDGAPRNKSAPLIVMTARFAAPKNHASLLRALAPLRERAWTLELVGEGPLQPDCITLAQELDIGDRVRFLGAGAAVPEVLSRADICVLISNWEGFPRSILEAMSAGLPVVASGVGGIPEAVQDGATGFLVPRADDHHLTDRLRLLISSAELRHRLGAASRRRYEEEFRFEHMFERTAALYQKVLANIEPH